MQKILIIAGPTATGKTKLGLKLAKQFNGELVSADSRQVYRGMDIGTGKDFGEKLIVDGSGFKVKFKNKKYQLFSYDIGGVPVWMYDVVNPDEEFSVSHYQYLTRKVISNIHQRGKLPVIVGGTGLYIRSLISPPEYIDIPRNLPLRQQLYQLQLSELQKRLKDVNVSMWQKLNDSDRKNPRRLVRKIEISQYLKENSPKTKKNTLPEYSIFIVGLTAPLPDLYRLIDNRVEERVKAGIENEITGLLKSGYNFSLESLNTLGYQEWKTYFDATADNGELRLKCINTWKFNEHAYARRQLTWFRKEKDINWFNIHQGHYQQKVGREVRKWYTKR